jgi:hypothetical protein
MIFKIHTHIILYSLLISTFISGVLYIKYLENVIIEDKYQHQLLEQNNDSNNIHINNNKIFIDSLKNEIVLLNIRLLLKDTTYIDTSKIDTVHIELNRDSSITYMFEDTLKTSAFNLKIKSMITIKDLIPLESSIVKYLELFPDTIDTYLIFNVNSKILTSRAYVNGVSYNSKGNMYEKVYNGIYEQLINDLPKKTKWKWWYNVGISAGISYNWKAEIIPYIGIGYTYTIGNIFD